MIEVRKQLPRVYYNESRDFQFLGRVFEVLFNYLKTGIDTTENLNDPKNIDEKLVTLLATTIGFEARHSYDTDSLRIICGCFHDIIKYKGTKQSIDRAVSALLNAQGITEQFSSDFDIDRQHVDIFIPAYAKDVVILKDLFEYILPVGWSYSILSGLGGDNTNYATNAKICMGILKDTKDTSELNIVAKLNDEDQDSEPVSTRIVSLEQGN